MNPLNEALYRQYPALRELEAMAHGGGFFFLAQRGIVYGSRNYPGSWADNLSIFGPTDVVAVRVRVPADRLDARSLRTCVWKCSGDLAAVIAALKELPPPDDPGAPKLHLPLPQGLWLPPGSR